MLKELGKLSFSMLRISIYAASRSLFCRTHWNTPIAISLYIHHSALPSLRFEPCVAELQLTQNKPTIALERYWKRHLVLEKGLAPESGLYKAFLCLCALCCPFRLSQGERWVSAVRTVFGITPQWFTEVSLGVCHQEGNSTE